jgi:hypothetical protein
MVEFSSSCVRIAVPSGVCVAGSAPKMKDSVAVATKMSIVGKPWRCRGGDEVTEKSVRKKPKNQMKGHRTFSALEKEKTA